VLSNESTLIVWVTTIRPPGKNVVMHVRVKRRETNDGVLLAACSERKQAEGDRSWW
jgi:hypothetical protein